MALNKSLSSDRVSLVKLFSRGNSVVALALAHALKARQIDRRLRNIILGSDFIADTAKVAERLCGVSLAKALCDFNGLQLAHSVDQNIRLAVE